MAGTIEISASHIRFAPTDGSGQVELPLAGLTLTSGGAADRLFFFSHPASDWSIYTADREVLNDPELRAAPALAPALSSIRRERTLSGLWLAAAAAIVVALIAGLFALKNPLVQAVARRLPPELERRAGDAAYSQIMATGKLITEPEVLQPLTRLAERLEQASGTDRYDFRLVVADDAAVNAFALPGGRVVLNSGLILKAATAEEIAGVMAHEIAHVTEQHSVRQLISNLGLFAVVQSLFGDVSGVAAVLLDGGATLLTMRFSRDFEREADDAGLQMLAAAGIDTAGLVRFFRVLLAEETSRATTPPELLSTHPATEERIAALARKAAGMKSRTAEARPLDLEALQAAVRRSQTGR